MNTLLLGKLHLEKNQVGASEKLSAEIRPAYNIARPDGAQRQGPTTHPKIHLLS